jgi:hypothetical protein
MKLRVIVCIVCIVGAESVASAQLVSQCAQDSLEVADAQGRNAWAASCGYISPGAVSFYNSQNLYVEFTAGCGHGGCSPFIPVTATDPCIANLVKLGLCETQAALTVTNFETGIDVFGPDHSDSCPEGPSCSFHHAIGSALTLSLTATQNTADCLAFVGWNGACAGQGSTCNLELDGDLSTSVRWGHITGCRPR